MKEVYKYTCKVCGVEYFHKIRKGNTEICPACLFNMIKRRWHLKKRGGDPASVQPVPIGVFTCKSCGCEFERKKSVGSRELCNRCRNRVANRRWNLKNNPPKPRPTASCVICGAEYALYAWSNTEGLCPACKHRKHARENAHKYNVIRKPEAGETAYTCKQCGALFARPRAWGSREYCQRCMRLLGVKAYNLGMTVAELLEG